MDERIERTLDLTKEQWQFIRKAIGMYEAVTNSVLDIYNIEERQMKIILPIYTQMPDEIF